MSGEIIGALIGIAGVVVLNIIMFAFGYGRLSERVKDYCARLERIETILNGHRVVVIEKGKLGDILSNSIK